MLARILAAAAPVVVALVALAPSDEHRVTPVSIEDPGAYWRDSGFAEMVPPVRLPSRDGRERIAVWLRVPADASIGVKRTADGRAALVVPPGTVADRVDMADGDDPESVGDVRGTRFEPRGGESFHVLRRLDGAGSPRLSGVEWARGDASAGAEATGAMVEGMDRAGDGAPGELQLFREQNDCASCHQHDKPERTRRGAATWPPPNRATDASGLYVVQTVLSDGAPLETHRARDMNVGDPFVRVTCGADGPPARLVTSPLGARHWRCDDDRLPYARYDLAAALVAGATHAIAVCRSRSYLYEHMDEGARSAFADAFAECGTEPAIALRE